MEIEVAPEHVHRTLSYLKLLAEQEQAPDKSSLDRFAVKRPPRLAWRRSLFDTFTLAHNAFSTPQPPDSVVAYLAAVGWVTLTDGPDEKVALTALGEAVLRGLDARRVEEPDESDVADVALDPDEPLTWVHLTRTFSAAGAGMLVDAYFKAEFVPWLLDSTALTRVLVSGRHHKARHDLAALAVVLGTLPGAAAKLEVRSTTSPELHDRCLIHENGTVQLLGASLTGVGRNLTAVISPQATIQKTYKELYERLWAEAVPLTPVSPRPDTSSEPVLPAREA
ncbi:hypothetical protein AB0M48_29895 [Lentzea sp. NPDC051208]|uniref:hypothetical protein n=1 Tax=Lentzea sp. NPDC051208 TaxID=3154642 RepID=UPI003447FDF4